MKRPDWHSNMRRERFNRIAKGLKRPCPYCGADIGQPCVSKKGVMQWSLGHTHDARLSTDSSRLKRSLEDQTPGRMKE